MDENEQVLDQSQYAGRVTEIGDLIRIETTSGEETTLPPDLSTFRRAEPGTYRLKSTGEAIVDPDFLSTWILIASKEGPDFLKESSLPGCNLTLEWQPHFLGPTPRKLIDCRRPNFIYLQNFAHPLFLFDLVSSKKVFK